MNDNMTDVMEFIRAMAAVFPYEPKRDRFGRTVEARDTDGLRKLAVKYKVRGCADPEEQAGEVARAIIKRLGYDE